MATDTTGSTVRGLKPGLRMQFGGCDTMFVIGNPSGIVVVPEPGAGAMNGVSGAIVAFDSVNNKYYQHVTGKQWIQIGSQSFG
jgi:hypothetical protein